MARRKNDMMYEEDDNLPLTEYSKKQREKNKDMRIKEQRRQKDTRKASAYSMSDDFYL